MSYSLKASKRIQNIANVLHLSEVVCLAATRLYTLAVEHKFTKGRRGMNVVAICLYIACRQKETRNYMLIDFSDLLQVGGAFYITRFLCPKTLSSRSMFLNWAIHIYNLSKPLISVCP